MRCCLTPRFNNHHSKIPHDHYNQGYKNLSKLVSIGFTEGYYYKPRIDLEVLEQYHEGLICTSACLAGSVNRAILANDMEKATEYIKKVAEVPSKIEQVESSTSGVAYKLKDVPTFELEPNVQNYILTMKGVLEND